MGFWDILFGKSFEVPSYIELPPERVERLLEDRKKSHPKLMKHYKNIVALTEMDQQEIEGKTEAQLAELKTLDVAAKSYYKLKAQDRKTHRQIKSYRAKS